MNDAARGKFFTAFGMALCLMKNYDPYQARKHFKMIDLLSKFDKNYNVTARHRKSWSGPDCR